MCQSIAHVWRIVISYADQFYPHMAHLDTQLIACMQRMISTATSGMENWPVVVEMGLCIVHWLRNLFAGRPCDALPAPAGGKRPRTSDPDTSQRGGARQRTDASADVTRGVLLLTSLTHLVKGVAHGCQFGFLLHSALQSTAVLMLLGGFSCNSASLLWTSWV